MPGNKNKEEDGSAAEFILKKAIKLQSGYMYTNKFLILSTSRNIESTFTLKT